MGINFRKERKPQNGIGQVERPQTYSLTGAGALNATEMRPYGHTYVTSTGSVRHTITLRKPTQPGMRKTITVRNNSTADVLVQCKTSASSVAGTTANTILFATGARERSVTLISRSTVAWSLLSMTTGVSFTASTLIVA